MDDLKLGLQATVIVVDGVDSLGTHHFDSTDPHYAQLGSDAYSLFGVAPNHFRDKVEQSGYYETEIPGPDSIRDSPVSFLTVPMRDRDGIRGYVSAVREEQFTYADRFIAQAYANVFQSILASREI